MKLVSWNMMLYNKIINNKSNDVRSNINTSWNKMLDNSSIYGYSSAI